MRRRLTVAGCTRQSRAASAWDYRPMCTISMMVARCCGPSVLFPRRWSSFPGDGSGGPKAMALQGRHVATTSSGARAALPGHEAAFFRYFKQ
jgi:hypothetical protein